MFIQLMIIDDFATNVLPISANPRMFSISLVKETRSTNQSTLRVKNNIPSRSRNTFNLSEKNPHLFQLSIFVIRVN